YNAIFNISFFNKIIPVHPLTIVFTLTSKLILPHSSTSLNSHLFGGNSGKINLSTFLQNGVSLSIQNKCLHFWHGGFCSASSRAFSTCSSRLMAQPPYPPPASAGSLDVFCHNIREPIRNIYRFLHGL